jgi:hypothetical protein
MEVMVFKRKGRNGQRSTILIRFQPHTSHLCQLSFSSRFLHRFTRIRSIKRAIDIYLPLQVYLSKSWFCNFIVIVSSNRRQIHFAAATYLSTTAHHGRTNLRLLSGPSLL